MDFGQIRNEEENYNRIPQYKGKVFITINHAKIVRELKFLGIMDPYIILKMGANKTFKTLVSEQGGSYPQWDNVSTIFEKEQDDDVLIGQVWCRNLVIDDVLIGEGAFSITRLTDAYGKSKRVEFLLFHIGEIAGMISLDLLFTPTSQTLPYLNTPGKIGKLIIKPMHVTLSKNINDAIKMESFCIFRFGKENLQTSVSEVSYQTVNWEDTLIFHRETDEDALYIEVWSQQIYGSNDFIGNAYISINDALSLSEEVRKIIKLNQNDQQIGEIEIIYTILFNGYDAIQMPAFGQVDQIYPNGDQYVDMVKQKLNNGQSKLIDQHGGYYKGMWQNHMSGGIGELIQGNTIYNGQFMNGKKNGQGQLIWNNGQGYNGSWLDNNMHGQGNWIFTNGTEKACLYINGQRTRWLDEDSNIIKPNQTKLPGFSIICDAQFLKEECVRSKQIQLLNKITQFNRSIYPPFSLRFEHIGQLLLIDADGQPYWISDQWPGYFAPPFILALQDDGKLVIKDTCGNIKWCSE